MDTTNQVNPANPEITTFLAFQGRSRKEIVITVYEETWKGLYRKSRGMSGPEFITQVTDLKTKIQYDLYRETCNGDCWCAIRAKPAKSVKMECKKGDGVLLFSSPTWNFKTLMAGMEDLTYYLRDKDSMTCYVVKKGSGFEILHIVED